MNTKFFTIVLLSALLLTVLACNQETKEEAKNDMQEISDSFKEKKDKWVAKMEAEIHVLEKRIAAVTDDAKLEAELEQAKQKLEDNLEKVKGASQDNWEKINREVETTYKEVEKELNKLKKEVEASFDND